MFNIKQTGKSFGYALRGFRFVWRENNFKIQIFCGLIVIFLMFVFQLTRLEKVALIFMIMTVLTLESLNTIFEHLSDILKPRLHEHIMVVKDIMAATVLMASLGAAVVGLVIFWPYFF